MLPAIFGIFSVTNQNVEININKKATLPYLQYGLFIFYSNGNAVIITIEQQYFF